MHLNINILKTLHVFSSEQFEKTKGLESNSFPFLICLSLLIGSFYAINEKTVYRLYRLEFSQQAYTHHKAMLPLHVYTFTYPKTICSSFIYEYVIFI